MKRDKRLIRKILEYVSDCPDPGARLDESGFGDDYSAKTVLYHISLCEQAGFLASHTVGVNNQSWTTLTLTWEGHNAIEQWKGC